MSDVDNKVKIIVEGLLMAAGRPLSLDNISLVFSEDERPDRKELKAVMEAIAEDCDDRGFELIEVTSGYRFQVKQDISEWVAKLWEEKPPRYTRALLETLALIAYRQPITRGDIEEIRGVGVSSNIIRTLLDREWIRVVGHRDVPGRPAMFATTKGFLDYFNLKSLQELPPLSEIKALDQTEQELDLDNELANQRVIDLPEDASDEASIELSDAEKAEMLAEEEAIELSKKPLDEILNLGSADADTDQESYDDLDSEGDSDDEDTADIAATGEDGDEASVDFAGDEDGDEGVAEERPLAQVIPLNRPAAHRTPEPDSDSEQNPELNDAVTHDLPLETDTDSDNSDETGATQAFIREDDDSLAADFAEQSEQEAVDREDLDQSGGDDNLEPDLDTDNNNREADKRD